MKTTSKHKIKIYVSFAIFLCLGKTCFAQEPQIESDRPGFSNVAGTVPHKYLQTEIGLNREADRFDKKYANLFIQHPTLTLRYGLAKRVELRTITEYVTFFDDATNGGSTRRMFTNVQVGGKWNFLQQIGIIPKMALIAHYRINFPKYDTINGGNVRLAMEHRINERFQILYNFGMQWDVFRQGTVQNGRKFRPQYLYSLSARYAFSDQWQGFAEFYGFAKKKRSPDNRINGGVSFFINDRFKIDASGGIGLSKLAPDVLYGLGGAYRFR